MELCKVHRYRRSAFRAFSPGYGDLISPALVLQKTTNNDGGEGLLCESYSAHSNHD